MALFPKIQSPCPYKGDRALMFDGDMCRLCHRKVHDLNAMSDAQRVAFIESCNGAEVCVSYRVPVAAAVLAAAVMLPGAAAACDATGGVETLEGGIRDTAHVQYVQYDTADRATPQLPVVYDDAKPAKDDKPAAPVKAPAAP